MYMLIITFRNVYGHQIRLIYQWQVSSKNFIYRSSKMNYYWFWNIFYHLYMMSFLSKEEENRYIHYHTKVLPRIFCWWCLSWDWRFRRVWHFSNIRICNMSLVDFCKTSLIYEEKGPRMCILNIIARYYHPYNYFYYYK